MVTGSQMIAMEWSMIAVTFILVCLRGHLRYVRKGKISLPDYFTMSAWVFFLAQAIMDTKLYHLGEFEGKIDPASTKFGPEVGLATFHDTVVALKIMYAETVIYYCTMYAVKAAMLSFFYELIPLSMRKLRLALNITTVITFLSWLSSMLLKIFACEPISSNWAAGEEHFCSDISSRLANGWEWAWHCFSDVLIYVLPIFLVRSLQLPLAAKLGVAFTFALGFVCIAFANIVQVSFTLSSDPPALMWLYSVLEQMWAIIVVCLPAFKALITRDRSKQSYNSSGDIRNGNSSSRSRLRSDAVFPGTGGKSKMGTHTKVGSGRFGKPVSITASRLNDSDRHFIPLEEGRGDMSRHGSLVGRTLHADEKSTNGSNTFTVFRETEVGVEYERNSIDLEGRSKR